MARKKTFTQEELYIATHQLMLEDGYDQFNFMKLAQALNVSRTALYKYYSNKDELLRDYLLNQMEDFVRRIETTEWPENYEEKLSELLDLVFDFSDTHRITTQVQGQRWTKENEHQPDIQKSKQLHQTMFKFIHEVITEGQQIGYLDPEIPSLMLIETIFHSVTLPNRAGLSGKKRSYFMKKLLFKGILNSTEN
ncbi:TetR/AcrR family transcriptional regulator [Aerococcaceae bacterium DSM 111021]|nr:TetR/AcrR family transcriptional regulator [Aerococcaceae bacterium DSM 111021]